MTRVLYTSWFSPFARKAALALELKGLQYEAVDGLAREFRPRLRQLNLRLEVPILVDGDITVVNSSDIVQYLEWRYPAVALYPMEIADRVTARALERLADHRLDPIVVDCSLWKWAERSDDPPAGLLAAGQKDLDDVLVQLESELVRRTAPWPFGSPGLVECAWYANLLGARPLGFTIDAARYPTVMGWLKAMREHPVFAADAKRTGAFLKALGNGNHERRRIFWSGDRIEWLFARGYHEWFARELVDDRVCFPP